MEYEDLSEELETIMDEADEIEDLEFNRLDELIKAIESCQSVQCLQSLQSDLTNLQMIQLFIKIRHNKIIYLEESIRTKKIELKQECHKLKNFDE